MGEVRQLRTTERCTLCGKDPSSIYADLDVIIRYRDDASNRYRSQLKVCIDCSDFLVLGREAIEDADTAPQPVPIRNEPLQCGVCSEPATMRIATGELRCFACAVR